MNTELFNRALGLVEPWTVSGYELDEAKERITLFVEPEDNSLLTCPHCENSYVARNDYKFFDFDYLIKFDEIINEESLFCFLLLLVNSF